MTKKIITCRSFVARHWRQDYNWQKEPLPLSENIYNKVSEFLESLTPKNELISIHQSLAKSGDNETALITIVFWDERDVDEDEDNNDQE